MKTIHFFVKVSFASLETTSNFIQSKYLHQSKVSYTPTPSEYSSVPSPTSDYSEDTSTRLTSFLRQLAVQTGRKLNVALMDHAYSKPSHWRSENTCAKPTKSLFVYQIQPQGQDEREVDVEAVEEAPIPPYDINSVSISMAECEKYIESVNPGEKEGDWEEQVDKSGWTAAQQRVFAKASRALHLARLARLAAEGMGGVGWREPIQRRVAVDKAARRLRLLLAAHAWEPRAARWLHHTLLDCLSPVYLAIYFDVLQTLRAKCPVLVDRMLASAPAIARPGLSGLDSLNLIVKQPWDPVAASLSEHKPQKLPGGPIIVIVPSAPMNGNIQSPRLKQWESYFGSLGVVVSVVVKAGPDMHKTSLTNCLDQMVCATRVKVAQLRSDFPQRHVVLVGWDGGAAAAAQVALVEQVSAVVCLGFPVFTVEGRRGEPNDSLLDLRCPAFFVIGQNAASVRQEDMEDIRERMKVETGLVIVGAADDLLRVSYSRKHREGLTQAMVDRCILDEVADFLGSILMIPRPPPLRSSSAAVTSASSASITSSASSVSVSSASVSASVQGASGTGSGVDVSGNIIRDGKRKGIGGDPALHSAKRSRSGTPLHGTFGLPIPASSPLPGFVGQRQKARSGQSHVHAQTEVQASTSVASSPQPHTQAQAPPTDQGNMAPSSITVNIGSLGSLTPLGPLRLQQNAAPPGEVVAAGDGGGTPGDRRRATSLTIQGNLISATTRSNAGGGAGSVATRGRTLAGVARSLGKEAAAGALTPLSSLLQTAPTASTASATSSAPAPSLLVTPAVDHVHQHQIKVLGALGGEAENPGVSARAHSAAAGGRMLDLSKLTVLSQSQATGVKAVSGSKAAASGAPAASGGVVVVAEGTRAVNPLLVAPSPLALLPLQGTKGSRNAGGASPTQPPRSFTLIPKISVPSLKLGQTSAHSAHATLAQTVTVASATKLAFPERCDPSVELLPDSGDERRADELTPDKILELPIIFAKDDDNLFITEGGGDAGGSTATPTVLPISSCGPSDASTVTLGDTISFPLDDGVGDGDGLGGGGPQLATRAVPNVFIIRSKGGVRERLQPPAGKRLLHKTHRFVRTADRASTSGVGTTPASTPLPAPSTAAAPGPGIKYTKIILTNRNSSLKVGETEMASFGSGGGLLRRGALRGGIIIDDEDEDLDVL